MRGVWRWPVPVFNHKSSIHNLKSAGKDVAHDTLRFPSRGSPVVFWFWVGVAVLLVPPIAFGLVMAALYLYIRWKYMGFLVRIFQEKPLFVIPRGQPTDDAEHV